jgi:hypothetical protein
MTVIVHVTPADLRDVPFREYAGVLGHLIGERYRPEGVTVLPGAVTQVVVVGSWGPGVADEVLEMSRGITRPELAGGYFG